MRSEHRFEIATKGLTNLYKIFLTREIRHFSSSWFSGSTTISRVRFDRTIWSRWFVRSRTSEILISHFILSLDIFTVAYYPLDQDSFLSDLTDSVSLSWFRCFVKKFFRRDNELSLKLDLDGVNRSKVPTWWAIIHSL